jgi:outer membrane protein OmpA-like peptidoglycan-associated protein
MHSSKTKEDIAREAKMSSNYIDNVIKDTSADLSIAIKPTLPIGVDENRTPVIDNKIYFGPGKAILDEEAKKYLLEMSNKLIGNLNLKLNISVHADANEEASIADYICKLRTKNITDLLLHKYNVNFSQLIIRSAGSAQGVNLCIKGDAKCSELDHQMNRRVEISIIP